MSLIIDTQFNKAPGSGHTTPSATPTCKRPTPLVGRWGDYAWDNFVEAGGPDAVPHAHDDEASATASPHSPPQVDEERTFDQDEVREIVEAVSPLIAAEGKASNSFETHTADSAPSAEARPAQNSPSTTSPQRSQNASPNGTHLRHAHQPYAQSPPLSVNSSFNQTLLPTGLTESGSASLAGSLNGKFNQPQWSATAPPPNEVAHQAAPPPPAHVHPAAAPQMQQPAAVHRHYPAQAQAPRHEGHQHQHQPQQHHYPPAAPTAYDQYYQQQQQAYQPSYHQYGGTTTEPAMQHFMPQQHAQPQQPQTTAGPHGQYPQQPAAPQQYMQPQHNSSYPAPSVPPALQKSSHPYFKATAPAAFTPTPNSSVIPAAAHHAPSNRAALAAVAPTGQPTALFANPSGGPIQITRFPPPPPPTARLMQCIEAEGTDPEIGRAIALRWYKKVVASQPAHPNVSPCPEPDFNLRPWRDWLNVISEWWKVNYANMKTSPIFGPPSVSPQGSATKRRSNNNRTGGSNPPSANNRSQPGSANNRSNPPSANNRSQPGSANNRSNPPSANNRSQPGSANNRTGRSTASSPSTTPQGSANNRMPRGDAPVQPSSSDRMGMGSGSQPSSANNRTGGGGSQPSSANRRMMKRHADPVDVTA